MSPIDFWRGEISLQLNGLFNGDGARGMIKGTEYHCIDSVYPFLHFWTALFECMPNVAKLHNGLDCPKTWVQRVVIVVSVVGGPSLATSFIDCQWFVLFQFALEDLPHTYQCLPIILENVRSIQ